MSEPTGATTIDVHDRSEGAVGPAPLDEHPEIRWARMDAREVVIKAARDPHRTRLRREAEVLQRIGADGGAATSVVGFVELVEGADHTELVTLRHGTVTLADVGLLSPRERTEALVSLCEALDELHRAGWVHGSIEAPHVLIDPGTPKRAANAGAATRVARLCSLGEAEQPRDAATGTSRAADLQALSTVVIEALEKPVGFGTRGERRRFGSAARKANRQLTAVRGLHDGRAVARVLDETIGRHTARRPTATVTTAARRGTAGTQRQSIARPHRWSTWLVACALVAALGVGAAMARSLHDGSEITTDCTVEVAGNTHACGAVSVDGNVVTVARHRFELGTPRDTVTVGDWDCDGTGTAVLLESRTGRLFHFSTWSTPTEEVSGEQIGTFVGATGLRTGRPCRFPEVESADGATVSPLEQRVPDPEETG